MPRKSVPIEALLLRTFLPAVLVVAILFAVLVYNLLYASILEGFERKLVTTSTVTGAMIDPADHDRLIAAAFEGRDPENVEATALYERNAAPIRRIRSELDLTYLYTQVIGGPSDVLYILDGSEGDEHSLIGSEDDLPRETMAGLKRVQSAGFIYVSPIEYQEQWGLLKTAAAPILGASGRITGSAGADVNISVIRVATQNALFASAMIGIGSILACVVVALILVRRIAKPIEALTEDTLRIAAGEQRDLVPTSGPREVAELRRVLGTLAGKMQTEAQLRGKAAEHHEEEAVKAIVSGAIGVDRDKPVRLIDRPDLVVAWIEKTGGGAEAALARTAMERLAQRLTDDPPLAQSWRELADLERGACVVIDGRAETIEVIGSGTPIIRVGGRPVNPATSALALPAGEAVALAGAESEFVLWKGKAS